MYANDVCSLLCGFHLPLPFCNLSLCGIQTFSDNEFLHSIYISASVSFYSYEILLPSFLSSYLYAIELLLPFMVFKATASASCLYGIQRSFSAYLLLPLNMQFRFDSSLSLYMLFKGPKFVDVIVSKPPLPGMNLTPGSVMTVALMFTSG